MIGDIIKANFPFSDLPMFKRRPAVVVGTAGPRLICLAVTSVKHCGIPWEIEIKNWKKAGLIKPSVVKVDTISTFFMHSRGLHVIGRLQPSDLERVTKAYRDMMRMGGMK